MRTRKLGVVELSRKKPFVYCGTVKRDNSEPERRKISLDYEILRLLGSE